MSNIKKAGIKLFTTSDIKKEETYQIANELLKYKDNIKSFDLVELILQEILLIKPNK